MFVTGKHGSMSSGELELILARNIQFCTVRRAGSGDGVAGICSSITGKRVRGIGGGRIPEYSYMRDRSPRLVRGWRNIMFDLLTMRVLRPSRGIRRWMGRQMINDALDYGIQKAPKAAREPIKIWLDGDRASGWSGIDGDPYGKQYTGSGMEKIGSQ